jgi:hypothetical protein
VLYSLFFGKLVPLIEATFAMLYAYKSPTSTLEEGSLTFFEDPLRLKILRSDSDSRDWSLEDLLIGFATLVRSNLRFVECICTALVWRRRVQVQYDGSTWGIIYFWLTLSSPTTSRTAT